MEANILSRSADIDRRTAVHVEPAAGPAFGDVLLEIGLVLMITLALSLGANFAFG